MTIRFALAGLLLSTTAALAGPFGLDMGMSSSRADAREPNSFGFSTLPEVPKRHPSLVVYSGKFGPQTGLCMIVGASRDFVDDGTGKDVREAFAHMRQQLDGVYGNSDLFDDLRTGARWDRPDDWVKAVLERERTYQASWDAASGAELKDGIVEILLTVRGFDPDRSDYALQYRFSNNDACERELVEDAQDVL